MQETVECHDVYRHHHNRSARVERVHEQFFRFGVFMDCVNDVKDVIFVRWVVTVFILVVEPSKGWHYGLTEVFQLVDEGVCKDSPFKAGDLLPVVFEGCGHLGHCYVWPAEPLTIPAFETRQDLLVWKVLEGLTIIEEEAPWKMLVIVCFRSTCRCSRVLRHICKGRPR